MDQNSHLWRETYEIHSVKKFGEGDLWIFTARIKSGKKDITLPMPLPVKWVGEIPVISMQDFTIPGLGTFSAHVVIDRGKYAGTWAHGNKGVTYMVPSIKSDRSR